MLTKWKISSYIKHKSNRGQCEMNVKEIIFMVEDKPEVATQPVPWAIQYLSRFNSGENNALNGPGYPLASQNTH